MYLKQILNNIYHFFYPRESDNFIKKVQKYYSIQDINIIFDVGSRDAIQSIELINKFLNAKVFAFECNKENIKICEENTRNHKNITIIPKAVNDVNGQLSFYQVTAENSSQISPPDSYKNGKEDIFYSGMSSIFKNDKLDEVVVDGTRLDTFCEEQSISSIDLLWIDLEGAELRAIKSLGNLLSTVKLLQVEAPIDPSNPEISDFESISSYLKEFGFDYLDKDRIHKNIEDKEGFTDVVFVNKTLVKN